LNLTLYASPLYIPVPSTYSNTCRVYEYCYEPDSTIPLTKVNAIAAILSGSDSGGKLHSTQKIQGSYDSVNALLWWDLVQGSQVQFSIKELGYYSVGEIPTSVSIRLSDLPSSLSV